MKVIDTEFLEKFKEWNFRTFGPGERTSGTIDHIKKELVEIESDPHDLIEWVDVILLAINGAMRHGYNSQEIIDAVHAKTEININRNWPNYKDVPEGQAITHVKEVENDESI